MASLGAPTGVNPEAEFLASSSRLDGVLGVRERRASFAGTTIQDHPTALPPSAFVLNHESRRASRFAPYRPPAGSGPDVRWFCVVKPPASPRQTHHSLATRTGQSVTPNGSPRPSHVEHSPRTKKEDSRAFYALTSDGPSRHGARVARPRSHTVSGSGPTNASMPSDFAMNREWVAPQMGHYDPSSFGTIQHQRTAGNVAISTRVLALEPSAELALSELLADSALSSPVTTEPPAGFNV